VTREAEEASMTQTKTYSVPGVHCGHCEAAVKRELEAIEGVESVAVDLETRLVSVSGTDLDDAVLKAAIDEAGFEVAA
jgi:copper chaperone